MSDIKIVPARREDAAAVAAFNERMRAARATFKLSTERPFSDYHVSDQSPVRLERYFAWVDGVLRGGVVIKCLPFHVGGQGVEEVAFYSYPVSEGIVNPEFGFLGLAIQKFVTRRYPLTYGLGTGGTDLPVSRLMTACGWKSQPVPFRFRVLRGRAFLRQVQFLRRRSRGLRLLFDFAAVTGLGALGFGVLHGVLRLAGRGPTTDASRLEPVTAWGGWADDIWVRAREQHALIGDRSLVTLQTLYPDEHSHLRRFRVVDSHGIAVGWFVGVVAAQRNSAYFGNLKLGTLVDCLAVPGHEVRLIRHALRQMKQDAADLAVTNQSSASVLRACRLAGMLEGPSNFLLFLAPKLQQRVDAAMRGGRTLHFTRGDGDGPIHLW